MKTAAALVLIALVLLPGMAFAGSSTDAALALGAFAVFNQIVSGTGVFARPAPVVVAPAPVYAAPAPVYAAPAPVYAAPAPVYVAPAPVYVVPRPVYVAPAPVFVSRPPVVVFRAHGGHGRHFRH